MKLLSVLIVLIFTNFTFAQDSFDLNVIGCSLTTFELNQCVNFCGNGHFKIVETTSTTFGFQGYLDSQCTQLGYFADTNTPYVIPFSCVDGQTTTVDNEGNTVTCHLENDGGNNGQDSFDFDIFGCDSQTYILNQCSRSTCVDGYFKIIETTSNSFKYQGYSDSQCYNLGYFAGTDIPYVIPFSCVDGQTTTVDNEGNTVTCHLENDGGNNGQDSFEVDILGCDSQTYILNQCGSSTCVDGYFKIIETTSNSFKYQGYSDSQCYNLSYFAGTDIPYVIPFSCVDGQTTTVDNEGNTVTCHLENDGGNNGQDSFEVDILGCDSQTYILDQCSSSTCVDGYFKIIKTTSNSFKYQGYSDSQCYNIGYFAGTNTPYIIPFSCSNGQTVYLDNLGNEVTCNLRDNNGISADATSIKSISLTVLFAFAFVLSLL